MQPLLVWPSWPRGRSDASRIFVEYKYVEDVYECWLLAQCRPLHLTFKSPYALIPKECFSPSNPYRRPKLRVNETLRLTEKYRHALTVVKVPEEPGTRLAREAVRGREDMADLRKKKGIICDLTHDHALNVRRQILTVLLTHVYQVNSITLEESTIPTTPSPHSEAEDEAVELEASDLDSSTAAFCFLSDVESLNDDIKEVWRSVEAGQFSAAQGLERTSQAIEFVKRLELELMKDIGGQESNGHLNVIRLVMGLPERQTDLDLIANLERDSSNDIQGFIGLIPLIALAKLSEYIRTGSLSMLNAAFPEFPFSPSGNLSLKDRKKRTLQLLMFHLGKIATAEADTLVPTYPNTLYSDTRAFITEKRRKISTHLVFGWSAWLESVHCQQAAVGKGVA